MHAHSLLKASCMVTITGKDSTLILWTCISLAYLLYSAKPNSVVQAGESQTDKLTNKQMRKRTGRLCCHIYYLLAVWSIIMLDHRSTAAEITISKS